MASTYPIRIIGDPVLRQRSSEITDITPALVKLAQDMLETMYEAPGVGLAAPQVGVDRRIFVYDIGDGPGVVINPVILDSDGEWSYKEGCLSIPDMAWDLIRPRRVHLKGIDLEGNDIDIEADELLARCFQHEVDHLDGVLVIERLDDDQRKEAMKIIRKRDMVAVQG
ncbi:MAG: peptide deformylase [Firmicutes bacterium]|jgi:peptide deformylase|nr:peptide deformylase [Bacillota bacterium]